MGVVVDTSVLIEAERDARTPEPVGVSLPAESHVASISVSELWYGVYRATTSQLAEARAGFIGRILESYPVVAFGSREARVFAELLAALRSAGTPIGERDLMIAATALANGHDVLTLNVRDFERVPGLTVQAP